MILHEQPGRRLYSSSFFLFLLVLGLSVSVTGCTLIGLGSGLAIDSMSSEEPCREWEITALPVGKKVVVTGRDDRVVRGRYSGLTVRKDPPDRFPPSLSQKWEPILMRLPSRAEPVWIMTTSGDRVDGVFGGFRFRRVDGEQRLCCILNRNPGQPGFVPMDQIALLQGRNGSRLDRDTLQELMEPGNQGFLCLLLHRRSEDLVIPLAEIKRVRCVQSFGMTLIGTALGLCCDYALYQLFKDFDMSSCLAGDTPILMADGSQSVVEDIRPGDRVMSYDLETGEPVVDTVMTIWSPVNDHLRLLRFSDGTLYATCDHPFRVKKKGWCALDPDLSARTATSLGTIGQLEIGDVCFRWEEGGLQETTLLDVRQVFFRERVFTIRCLGRHTVFFSRGYMTGVEAVRDPEVARPGGRKRRKSARAVDTLRDERITQGR